jgi:parallel beta-helix repeat protein
MCMMAWSRSAWVRPSLLSVHGVCVLGITALLAGFPLAPAATAGVHNASCPRGAIGIEPAASIEATVESAADGAVFCLKNGIHRAQAVRPRPRQHFYGEGATILNGSRLLTDFRREGRYWVASSQPQQLAKHGECLPSAPGCDRPDAVFVDDNPLTKASSKETLASNEFYVDYDGARIYFADDPTGHKVEATVAAFAFESAAPGVSISNLIVEKYGSPAQKGAIHAREGTRWTIEDCVVRLNSGAGISVGSGTRVRNCDVHHNGQIGIEGDGKDILIEGNRISSNNIYGFDPAWEAGGAKIAESNGVTFRDNHVYDNYGSGLWCDINCRNVLYEGNVVENNKHIGIFHEISFKAVIRNNTVGHNGSDNRKWFWGTDIVLAASQDVEVTGNTVTVAPGACGIMLLDQGRHDAGVLYKTRNNVVQNNDMTFEGTVCAGGAGDTPPGNENFTIISSGNNRFDGNTYRVRNASEPLQFVWDRDVLDWSGFRGRGLEQTGRLILSGR